MSPALILSCIAAYFCFLLLIAWVTSRKANEQGYFLGNKNSPWVAVMFGLIGDSLSGVTFISVPGVVGTARFSYLQMVFGYVLGYAVIALVLLPLYYRLNLISIYSYLKDRFGVHSQRSGAFFFLISRLIGSAFRLYLAAAVLQRFVFDHWNIPFWCTVTVIIGLILAYTYRGGIKTLVWTDTFQSALLLTGLVLSIVLILRETNLGIGELGSFLRDSPHTQIFFWDWRDKQFFFKQFLSGAFVAIVMTGLDQNSMQKNLSCRSLRDAQKNLFGFSIVQLVVNFLFLSLGALLYFYAETKSINVPAQTDQLFPLLALEHLGPLAGLFFVVGLAAATFSSADSVLTTLTTSFCIDVMGVNDRNKEWTEAKKTALRHQAHIGFALLLLLVILVFRAINNKAVIDGIFTLAGYTYGPLLGLFAFGLIHRARVNDRLVPIVCVVSPAICYLLNANSVRWLGGYKFGYELLMLNGLLTYLGLWMLRKNATVPPTSIPSVREETA